jgi:hypothetical protein
MSKMNFVVIELSGFAEQPHVSNRSNRISRRHTTARHHRTDPVDERHTHLSNMYRACLVSEEGSTFTFMVESSQRLPVTQWIVLPYTCM